MKVFSKNAIIKKILIVIITIIMINNFIMPNYVHAANGGKLFTPITEFLVGISDRIMATLEAVFVGKTGLGDPLTASEIKVELPGQEGWLIENIDGTYNFQYSPAIIFSGKVPAFDINFINPMKDQEFNQYSYEANVVEPDGHGITYEEVKKKYGAPQDLLIQQGNDTMREVVGRNKCLLLCLDSNNC